MQSGNRYRPKIWRLRRCGSSQKALTTGQCFLIHQGSWWLYDADTNKGLESAHRVGKKWIERVMVGNVHVISLTKLKQY